MKLDPLDVSILRAFIGRGGPRFDAGLSFGAVARRLGSGEERVRSRYRAMEAGGVIRGRDIRVHPGTMARHRYRIDLSAGDVPLADTLCESEGAVQVLRMMQGRLGFIVDLHEQDLARTERWLHSLGAEPQVVLLPLPPCTVALVRLDWKIVAAMRAAPDAGHISWAQAVGRSERTVRRRIDQMVDGRAIISGLDVDPGRAEGGVNVELRLRGEAAADDFLDGIEATFFRTRIGNVVVASVWLQSLAELEAVRQAANESPGIDVLGIDGIIGRETCGAWLDAEVARRAA